jgi:arginase family enzyme
VDIDRRLEINYDDIGLVDIGDVVWQPGEGLDIVGARLAEVTRRVFDAGLQPVILGGDHSGTRWVLSSLIDRGREFGVIHLDAHHDLYGLPDSRPSHSNALELALLSPSVVVLHQIGLRGFHVEASFRTPVANPKLSLVTAREARTRSAAAVLEGLPRDIPYYVTIDIDCLDPVIAPETGTPLPGGLPLALVEDLLHAIGTEFEILGIDLMEVSAGERRQNQAAAAAGLLLARILLAGKPSVAMGTHVFSGR